MTKFSNKPNRIQLQYFFWLIACCITIESCTIEKRRYTGGFHVEKRHSKRALVQNSEHVSSEDNYLMQADTSCIVMEDLKSNDSIASDCTIAQEQNAKSASKENFSNYKEKKFSSSLTSKQILKHEVSVALIDVFQSNKQSPQKGKGNAHPDAFASLLLGIAAMGCLAGIFLTGASPVILFAGFLAAMLVFAFFATRLAKRAFKDMHYARDRFGGKAMAATGMLLGVLSIVAFLGLITIVVLGIAFVNLT